MSLRRRSATPAVAAAIAAMLSLPGGQAAHSAYADTPVSTAMVVVPIVFPVVGRVSFSDTFLACRSGCARKHFGQDLMGAKMLPLVAAFDGYVSSLKREQSVGDGNYVTVTGDSGWSANYIHVNNDTPGTDDGRGTARYAFAPGLDRGDRVFAGQLLGWLGDSGNAEGTGAHLHFELRKGDAWSGVVYNAYPSLVRAARIPAPRLSGPHTDGLLVKGSATGPVFLLWQGRRRLVRPGVFTARAYSSAQVLQVNPNEERWYPLGTPAPLPDGRVYKAPDGSLWLVAGARRYPVPTAKLAGLGVPLARVRTTDDAALASTPLAPADAELPGVFREGALLKEAGKPAVYVVQGGLRRHLPDVATLVSNGWNLADVVELPAGTFDPKEPEETPEGAEPTEAPAPEVPDLGAPVVLRDGVVVANMINRWFVVSNGKRRYVTPEIAKLFGYDRLPKLKPGELVLNRLPLGEPLP